MINAKRLLHLDNEQLRTLLRGHTLQVQFDDAVVTTYSKDIILSHVGWRIHRQYPLTPLKSTHLISRYVKEYGLQTSSSVAFLNAICMDAYQANLHPGVNRAALMDSLIECCYRTSNDINSFSAHIGAWVVGFDVTDVIAILDNPRILQAKKDIVPTQEGIDEVYKVIKEELVVAAKVGNPLALAIMQGSIKLAQALQCLGPRGFLTEINSSIFPTPILVGFAEGITSIHDFAIETRSAAKALAHTTTPLQQGEYLSRQLQHIAMGVKRLHRGDCGSDVYLEWYVADRVTVGGLMQMECDLVLLEGKYHLHESGELRMIKKSDKHLIGTTVRLRSPMAGCKHSDIYGICSTCFGVNGDTVPEFTGLGHYCIAALMEIIIQRVISTKHFDGSASIVGIHLTNAQRVHLWAHENSNEYHINYSAMKHHRVSLVLRNSAAEETHVHGITDIMRTNDVYMLDITRISQIKKAVLRTVDNDGVINEITMDVDLGGRIPSLTHQMLEYIRVNGYSVDTSGAFIVDLQAWDCTKPFLRLPLRHYNMSDLRSALETFLTGESMIENVDDSMTTEDQVERKKGRRSQAMVPQTPVQLMRGFVDLVSAHVNVPFAYLEVIMLGNMVTPTPTGFVRQFPKYGQPGRKITMTELYMSGSMGALMAWEGHLGVLMDPGQLLLKAKDRPDHPMDVHLAPTEVMAYEKQGGYRYRCAWACCEKKNRLAA